MKKILDFVQRKHSILFLLFVLAVLDIALVVEIFFSTAFVNRLINDHLFEILVLTALLEIILILSSQFWITSPLAIGSEEEAQQKILSTLSEDSSIRTIRVLSAGLGKRNAFLRSLLEDNRAYNVEVVTSFGEDSRNPDEMDRTVYGPSSYTHLTDRLRPEEAQRLTVYKSANIPSTRAIILFDSKGAKCAVVGWYSYSNGKNDIHIQGRRNLQIFVDRATDTGVAMLRFVEIMFTQQIGEDEATKIWPAP